MVDSIGNVIVSAINLGFILFLVIIGMILYVIYFTKKPTQEELAYFRIIMKMWKVVLVVTIGIFVVLLLVEVFSDFTIFTGNDISNWVTLTVEVAIGIIIAMLIMMYSHFRGEVSSQSIKQEKSNKRS